MGFYLKDVFHTKIYLTIFLVTDIDRTSSFIGVTQNILINSDVIFNCSALLVVLVFLFTQTSVVY